METFRRTLGMEFVNELVRRQVADANNDPNVGKATQNQKPVSASQILSTLAPVALVAIVWLVVFIIARPRFSYHYSPRASSKMLKPDEHSKPLSPSLFGWLSEFWAIPDTYILARSSLDAYFFLRLLKMSVVICIVGAAITWPILFPVNATGKAGREQLDKLTFGNIDPPTQSWRYFAHVGCMYVFFGFILVLITRESIYYVNLRQAYLMNPGYTKKVPSRTVLFAATPDDYLHEHRLTEMLGRGVRRVWYPTDTKKLDDLVKERTKAVDKLEKAETKLIIAANAARMKGGHHNTDVEAPPAGEASADHFLPEKKRPSHRTKPLIGKKVDTIHWARSEIARLNPLIEEEQARHRSGDAKKWNAVFVEFDSLSEAQAAYQSLTHHQMLKMAPRYIGMHPREIIWSNLKIKGWQRFVRLAASIAIVVATIIFWSIPVAFIGSISNIKSLITLLPWLSFLNKLPTVIFGVVQGLLPVILLALLMSLLPRYLRFMAKLGGDPTKAAVEYTLSNYYFAFQVLQVFLVTTLSSAASNAVKPIIDNPTQTPSILAKALPAASNFYLSYIILQGLGIFSGTLAALSGLVIRPLLAALLAKTPRKKFLKWNSLKQMGYGALYPVYTNLLVIAIVYSIIAPLVTGLSIIGLFFFYFAFRYNVLYVYSTGPDTQGLLYPRALQQLFVGLYLAEICMIGLIGTTLQNRGSLGPFILMILLLVGTVLYHVSLNAALRPLLNYLPKTLDAEERKAARVATERAHEKNGHNGTTDVRDDADIKDGHHGLKDAPTLLDAPKHPKPNMITKFLKPHIYCDYPTMRRLMPIDVKEDEEIDPSLARDAYLAPSVWNEVPRIVVPRDPAGISGVEVVESGKIVPITDNGATLNEKNKMVIDDEVMGDLYFKEKSQRMGYDL